MNTCKTFLLAASLIACAAVSHGETATSASLYLRLGGMPAIRAVVNDFVDRILADHRVNQWFAHAASDPANAAAYKTTLAVFLCQGTGGPCHYQGHDMATAHKGRGVTSEAFDAVVEDLMATLSKFNVPAKEKSDLQAILGPMKSSIVDPGR